MFRIKVILEEEQAIQPLLGTVVYMQKSEDSLTTSAEGPSKAPTADENDETLLFFSGNPEVQSIKGVLRFFKDKKSDPQREHDLELPTKRSDLVCLLAMPSTYTSDEVCRFLGGFSKLVFHVRILRDQRPDRFVLILKFVNQESADDFFREYNGKLFSEMANERCKVAFLSSVEFLEPRDAALFTLPPQTHEIPNCPVCLERLEEQASGIFTTLCNHSFHCSCLAQWRSADATGCPVCRYTFSWEENDSFHSSTCQECGASDSLWICLICGFVGCSRYRGAHAHDHWRQSGHIFSLELDTQRVWDYGGDGYVHRLIQNKTDGKVVEFPSPFQSTDFREPEKIQKIVTEYNYLLMSQLDAQRAYYEDLLVKSGSNGSNNNNNHQHATPTKTEQKLKEKLLDTMKKNKFLTDLNSALESDRDRFNQIMKKYEQEKGLLQGKIGELEEQCRDLIFTLEGSKAVQQADALESGDVVTIERKSIPLPKGSSGKKKKKKK